MAVTIDDIYSSLKKSKEYSGNIKKTGNQITVYLDIALNKKSERIKKITEIKDYLKKDIPSIANTIAYNRTGSRSSIGRIEIYRTGQKTLVVFLKPVPKLSIDKNWLLNEEMFPEISMEYYSYAEEDGNKFTIKLVDGIKTITIGDVKSVYRVGGKNKKPDVIISTNGGRNYSISMKLPQFRTWQSYANFSSLARTEATKVLDNVSNLVGTFSKPNSKLSVKSTVSEVVDFCFGGFGDNKVDYIITSSFPFKSPSKSFVYDSENKVLTVNVDKIYTRNPQDYEELRKNCYMLIEKDAASNIGTKYPRFRISYVSKSIADTALPGKR